MATAALEGVRGLLLDIDGTLLENDRPIPGAAAAIERLRARRLPFRLITNTSRRSRRAIASVLARGGFSVPAAEILTPSILARKLILESGRCRAALLIPEEARADLEGVQPDEERPDWVVLGDLGRRFTWERLNDAFRLLRGGARLLALHKNPFWFSGDDGWVLDAGAFAAALEYATGVAAIVVGKPSLEFFRLAIAKLDRAPGDVLVVGDDPETDVAGGAAAGCRTALVGTGKGAGVSLPLPGGPPDLLVLGSIADLAPAASSGNQPGP